MNHRAARVQLGSSALAAIALIASGCAPPVSQSPTESPSASSSPAVSPLPLVITSASFHTGEVGVAYAPVTLNATGGVSPYAWSVTAGSLPPGLTIAPNGTVAGNPNAAGTFKFTLQLADAAGGTAKAARSVGIARALRASLIPGCVVQCLVEVGCVSVCGKFGTLVGGVAPFTYTSLGNIPLGVRLSGLTLAGTFAPGGRYWQFSVNVTDAFGASTSITPTFNVFPHITFTGGTCQGLGTCRVLLRYTVGVSETPGVKVVSWAGDKVCGTIGPVVVCPAPSFTASVAGGYVTIDLASPNDHARGTYKLSLFDQFPCGSGVHCSTTATLRVLLNG
jgi:putative Ig domain-containing protein